MRALANLINLVKLDLEGCLKIHGGFIHLKGTFSEGLILPEHHLCASMPESSGSSSLSQCSDILCPPANHFSSFINFLVFEISIPIQLCMTFDLFSSR
jgi:hypothetical protein